MATMVQSNTYQLPSSKQFKVFGRGASPPPPPSPSRRTRGSSNIQYGAPGVKCRRSVDMEHAVGILLDYDDDEECEQLEMFDEPEEIGRSSISFAGFTFGGEEEDEEEEDEEDDYMSTTQEGLFTFKEDATLVPSAPAPLLALLAEQAETEDVTVSIPELSPLEIQPSVTPEVAIVPPTPSDSEPTTIPTEPSVAIRSPPKRQSTLQALRDAPPPPPARVPPPLPPRTPSPVPRILISPPDEHEREQEREEAVLEVVEATKVSRTTASVVSVAALASVIVGPHINGANTHEKTPLIKRSSRPLSPPPPPPSGSWSSGWVISIAVVLVLTPTVLLTAHFLSK